MFEPRPGLLIDLSESSLGGTLNLFYEQLLFARSASRTYMGIVFYLI